MGFPINSRQRRKAMSRGFSLLELLVVVLIMSMALGLFLGYNYRQRDTVLLRTTARDVYQWAMAAKSYAILDGRENPGVYYPEEHALREGLRQTVLQLPEGVRVVRETRETEDEQLKVPVALFYPDGSAERSRIVLAVEEHEIMVRIDPVLGEVTILW